MEKILTLQKLIKSEDKNLKTTNESGLDMNDLQDFKKREAECVGLWLAEGGNKSKSEITFTNNCLGLVDLFKKTINEIFKDCSYNQRIYVYSKTGKKIKVPYDDCVIKYYAHERATKPFFIYRIASVKLIGKWREIVNKSLNLKEFYPYVLRGFFAGEGNIKEVSHNSRVLRIAQKERKEFIDVILKDLGIKFSFNSKGRSYEIHGKPMWDIFANLKLADLHPHKKRRFWEVYNHFKEEHYETNFLINNILPILNKPITTKKISQIFNRSPARITDVLVELKKQDKVNNFRIRSVDYWTNNPNLIIISKLKKEYLILIDNPRPTSEFAKYFKIDWKSSFRRLKELEKLNLVRRLENGKWMKLPNQKTIAAI